MNVPKATDGGVLSVALLEVCGCTVSFSGLKAVSDVSLRVARGEIVGLIGPNGAGKTTVFNMLTGIYPPRPGEIRFEGRSLLGLRPHRINRLGIARTFQNIRLFSHLTTEENVLLACHPALGSGLVAATFGTAAHYASEDRAAEQAHGLLDQLDLAPFAKDHATNLSYGDQRRLEIARALATRPRLLLLDEPTAGMNPREKGDLAALIRKIRERYELAILVIEHDMRVVMGICERIIVMDHGEVIAEGSPKEIQANPRVIEAYLGEQKPEVLQ